MKQLTRNPRRSCKEQRNWHLPFSFQPVLKDLSRESDIRDRTRSIFACVTAQWESHNHKVVELRCYQDGWGEREGTPVAAASIKGCGTAELEFLTLNHIPNYPTSVFLSFSHTLHNTASLVFTVLSVQNFKKTLFLCTFCFFLT